VPDEFVRQNPADVVQDEAEAHVLEDGTVRAGQDVLQVGVLVGTDPGDVRVQARLPGPVAQPPAEFGQVKRVIVQLAAVQPLQPALTADIAQVGGQRRVVNLGPGDQEHLGLHALHASAPYRRPSTSARTG
jgi:hypothetical protein